MLAALKQNFVLTFIIAAIALFAFYKSTTYENIKQIIYECNTELHNVVVQESNVEERKPKCLKNVFKDVVLVMNFNYAFYGNKKILHELYDNVFGQVLACGLPAENQEDSSLGPDILYNEPTWYYRYRCLTKAIQKYPGYKGTK